MRLDGLVPMLSVVDLSETRRFYQDLLGFRCDGTFEVEGRTVWLSLVNGEARMYFNEISGQRFPADYREQRQLQVYYFRTQSVVEAHRELRSRGALVSELRVTIYGMKEFELTDPDGYRLWFGAPTNDLPTVRE